MSFEDGEIERDCVFLAAIIPRLVTFESVRLDNQCMVGFVQVIETLITIFGHSLIWSCLEVWQHAAFVDPHQ